MESEVIICTDAIYMFFNLSNHIVNDQYNRIRLIQAFSHILFSVFTSEILQLPEFMWQLRSLLCMLDRTCEGNTYF